MVYPKKGRPFLLLFMKHRTYGTAVRGPVSDRVRWTGEGGKRARDSGRIAKRIERFDQTVSRRFESYLRCPERKSNQRKLAVIRMGVFLTYELLTKVRRN